MADAGMLKRWRHAKLDERQRDLCQALARELKLPPLIAQLLCRRGLTEPRAAEQFLHPRLSELHDPARLPGVVAAAARLEQAVRDRQPIVIYGDYDVDGITASAILWHTLHTAGADVTTYVPHRIEEGYGLNCEAIARIAAGGRPHAKKPLIISVDCGITAVEPARVAREAGVDLIITDHHLFDPEHLPEAYALVHPRLSAPPIHAGLPADGAAPVPAYPFPELCGAGVAFKLAWQFAKVHCGSERVSATFRDLLLDLLSLAALGTIADVVPLIDENRVITYHGLGQIKRTRFAGLNALIDASRLRDEKIDSFHVGFVLAPRLNACGRMGHAKEAVHLLTLAEGGEAARLAGFLAAENDRRRATERAIFEEARRMVIEAGYDKADCRAIVVGKEGWHPGVVGIVASRLVEAFARPVIMLNLDPASGEAHGSARSVEGVSIHDAIAACAQHLRTFGGHAMAAGLRLETTRLEAFRESLVSFVNQRLAPEDLVCVLPIDAACELAELTVELVDQISRLAPFGRENPLPRLCVRGVRLERPAQRMGGAGKHLSLMLRQGPRLMRAVWWNMGEHAERLAAGTELDVVFEPQASEWQGQRRVEMHIKDVRLASCRV